MKNKLLGAAVALLLFAPAAGAQQKSPVSLKSTAEVEVVRQNEKGEKEAKRVDAATASVQPGDVVIYTTEYQNTGTKPAENVVISNPIPDQMVYIDKSAEGKGAKIEFSVDGGKTYGAMAKLTVKDKDGRVRPALAKDITGIRWTVPGSLAPGGKGVVGYRARVK